MFGIIGRHECLAVITFLRGRRFRTRSSMYEPHEGSSGCRPIDIKVGGTFVARTCSISEPFNWITRYWRCTWQQNTLQKRSNDVRHRVALPGSLSPWLRRQGSLSCCSFPRPRDPDSQIMESAPQPTNPRHSLTMRRCRSRVQDPRPSPQAARPLPHWLPVIHRPRPGLSRQVSSRSHVWLEMARGFPRASSILRPCQRHACGIQPSRRIDTTCQRSKANIMPRGASHLTSVRYGHATGLA